MGLGALKHTPGDWVCPAARYTRARSRIIIALYISRSEYTDASIGVVVPPKAGNGFSWEGMCS